MSLNQSKARLSVVCWTAASSGSFLAGALLALVVACLTGLWEAFFAADEGSFSLVTGLVWASTGAIVGALIGLGQWLVLRRRMDGARWWILASTLGFGLGNGLGAILHLCVAQSLPLEWPFPSPFISTTTMWSWVSGGAACGLILGSAQWLVLRRSVRSAAWWIPANIVSWAAAATLGEYAGETIWRIFHGAFHKGFNELMGAWWLGLSYLVLEVQYWEGLLVVGVLASAITGLAVAWLLRRPIHNRR